MLRLLSSSPGSTAVFVPDGTAVGAIRLIRNRRQGLQMLDLPGAIPASYLGSSASVPVYRHVRDPHRLHLSQFADVHQQVVHGRGVIGMDPRGCQPGAFELEAA
jgi:hypothetical protein